MLKDLIPLQGFVLHSPVSNFTPTHSAPPQAGEGRVQSRVRVRVPPLHVAEQSP
ncbi:hypothetical protein DPMN_140694 [Dreissena polymorpha]|uniref:Uncharacterized protein n=1 Tax=Dreissena polymorpha TaxID=45954 RepID=A0A9D4JKL4_DREPO|nr:hypothetical protein DPMN_140694 [Dreissena polymorpha]